MVFGTYTERFRDATHIVANGHLDDPSFRRIAISKITGVSDQGHVTAVVGGTPTSFQVRQGKRGEEYVDMYYRCPIFGNQRTRGCPFVDTYTKESETPND